jgi:hypothetical protein
MQRAGFDVEGGHAHLRANRCGIAPSTSPYD